MGTTTSTQTNRTLFIDLEQVPQEVRAGIAEIQRERPKRFGNSVSATVVAFVHDDSSCELSVSVIKKTAIVRYSNQAHAFRALGRLLGDAPLTGYTETCRFDMLGAMVDVSRNGVLRVDAAKAFLLRPKLGVDGLQYVSALRRRHLRSSGRAVLWLSARPVFAGGIAASSTVTRRNLGIEMFLRASRRSGISSRS